MKKSFFYWLPVFFALFLVGGCGQSGSLEKGTTTPGAISFNLNFTDLVKNNAKRVYSTYSSNGTPQAITAVSVTLSRSGHSDITQDLSVSNNIATGTVTGLDSGYWHIVANVYHNNASIYTGAVDVDVIAGAQVTAQILFDPADTSTSPPSTGSVALTVGYNKYPGYSKLNQTVSTILQDSVNQKIYIYDSSLGVIAVYDAGTMVREKDLQVSGTPQAMAVATEGGSIFLGYSTGKIYRLNVSDESLVQVADSLMSVNAVVPISSKYLLAINATTWGPSNTYKSIDVTSGQAVSTKSDWYPLYSFAFNQQNGMTYGLDTGLSPADIHRIAVNNSTGSIDTISDSRYHGDYNFGGPISVINHGSRIATASGNMFVSSALSSDDITYAGNLGHPYLDLASDDTLDNLYMLNRDNITKLLVLSQSTFFQTLAVDLVAQPQRVFNTPNGIVVFVKDDSTYYVKVFSKHALGLS
ncbi:hypothetical protein [Geomesophilobacter sediminis]|uniref:Uncharacterized protein n=1 Tax=Geomesophilobacter sediminis TaxID=2798584 RepID=A0A8J7J785_9BACT|nr:hypothetical protein [Geomesophilobacter sediminis]MBJ6724946.1 hypothetical protein [Geomesophilobacter sediminis]